MEKVNTYAGDVRLVGERLCLDFCNTVDDHRKAQPKEYLKTYADLVIWSQHSDILAAEEAAELDQSAAARPEAAAAVLAQAKLLRALLVRLFSPVADGQPISLADLARFNASLAETPARAGVIPAGAGFTWSWAGPAGALDRMLWPVSWSAADLLTSPDLVRVRQCAGTGCGWLFLDLSRNRTRRWCTMEDCGNRAKVHRHYVRNRVTPG